MVFNRLGEIVATHGSSFISLSAAKEEEEVSKSAQRGSWLLIRIYGSLSLILSDMTSPSFLDWQGCARGDIGHCVRHFAGLGHPSPLPCNFACFSDKVCGLVKAGSAIRNPLIKVGSIRTCQDWPSPPYTIELTHQLVPNSFFGIQDLRVV